MPRNKKNRFALCLLGIASFFLIVTGCDGSPKLKGLVPVKGIVSYKDSPLDGAVVTFSPKESKQGARAAVAITNEKGEFELITLSQKGAFPGDYLVSITKNTEATTPTNQERAEQMKKRQGPTPRPKNIVSVIPRKYNDEKRSGLMFNVGEQGRSDIEIILADEH